jgi:hypothetical protein
MPALFFGGIFFQASGRMPPVLVFGRCGMTIRQVYLPLFSVRAGMTLARPAVVTERQVTVLRLPAGHELTENNLAQLRAHHAHYLCIAEEDTRGEVLRAQNIAAQSARLERIFRNADPEHPETRAFQAAVRAYRLS